ncbi:MAG: response regulator transcription factor [Lachnospiraceae bacterium]|nr:response regulator transcription factor [Lachnospiraceae bacterium]
MFHISIAEDDLSTRNELKLLLENSLYQVTAIEEYKNVADQVLSLKPDLLLLDINLPDKSGFFICEELRRSSEIPIIFLTAQSEPMDELNGILKGGDDYITKPYIAPILLARIAAVLKRTRGQLGQDERLITYHEVVLDLASGQLSFHGKSEDLTKNELKILYCLLSQPGIIISRADLIEYLWDNQVFIDDNALSVNMTRIRNKLEQMGLYDFIETKRGMGYKI